MKTIKTNLKFHHTQKSAIKYIYFSILNANPSEGNTFHMAKEISRNQFNNAG